MDTVRVVPLLSSRSHPAFLSRRRSHAIVLLTRGVALLFGVLTLTWIAVDFAVFDAALAARLAVVRAAVAGALFGIWRIRPRGAPGLGEARLRLALLFGLGALFYLGTQRALDGVVAQGFARGIAAAYALVPYAMASAIAAFPLVALESAALAAPCFALLAWTYTRDRALVGEAVALDAFWLLFLIVGAASFAAASQLRLLAALVRQATRDPLTACLRRESGRELLESHFVLSQRNGTPLAVLFADLDRFKAVNDAWGHEAGDTVLAAAASALRDTARGSDTVLRWGGEEFVVVLPGASAEEAMRWVERLGRHGAITLPDGSAMTLSIGVAERDADAARNVEALVGLADKRMYGAKQAGRNRCIGSGNGAPRAVFGV